MLSVNTLIKTPRMPHVILDMLEALHDYNMMLNTLKFSKVGALCVEITLCRLNLQFALMDFVHFFIKYEQEYRLEADIKFDFLA